MCGITACLDFKKREKSVNGSNKGQSLEEEIEKSLDLVKHRGPDARGQWISSDGRVGMVEGHMGFFTNNQQLSVM
jgi:asparagine synthase (glutamine-hydrolysing)